MRDHDIQLLALGFGMGTNLMLLVQLIGGVLDDRRDRSAVRAAAAELAARREPDFVDTYADPAIIGKAGRP
jgi:hypothetical protein